MNIDEGVLHPLWLAAVAVGGLVSGPVLSRISHRRSLAQPTPEHTEVEPLVVDAVLEHPGLYVYVHQLEARHFVDEAQGERWQRIKNSLVDIDLPQVADTSEKSYRTVAAYESSIPSDLAARTGLTSEGRKSTPTTPKDLVEKASLVYSSGLDREEFSGRSRIERTGDPERPLTRRLDPPGWGRHLLAGALAAFGAVVSLLAAHQASTGTTAQVFAALSLLALTAGSVVWTLVDLDTMYIDTRSFLAGALASWILALFAVGVDDRTGDALAGILGAGGIVLFIEIVNQFYKRIRGQHGMGMGDYMLIVATIGVPVAVTGSWQLTQGILIVSLLAGILGWITLRLSRQGFSRSTPYAFGPYLATGWMVTLLLWVISR